MGTLAIFIVIVLLMAFVVTIAPMVRSARRSRLDSSQPSGWCYDLFVLGSRLLGLWLFVTGLITTILYGLMQIEYFWDSDVEYFDSSMLLQLVPTVMMWVCGAFLLKYPTYLAHRLHLEPSGEKPPQLPVHDILAVGIALVGIHYIVLHGDQLLYLVTHLYNGYGWEWDSAMASVRQGAWLLIMVLLVARHRRIADWILRVDAGARTVRNTDEDKTN